MQDVGACAPLAGNPAVMDVSVGRPVALRPHLSMGLPFQREVIVWQRYANVNAMLTE